jgi:lipid-binding SYLF domain-containing protein
LVLPAIASDRGDDIGRIQKATQVFQEIMRTPDKGIPQDLLEKAKCLAIVPGEEKLAFIFGGNYGGGLATCRTANGWSAPMFVAVGGGSVGFQIGGSFTDVVMLFMNDNALQRLLGDKFTIGADATVAAGPVGRQAAVDTDIRLDAEILSYSRSKGVFAGVRGPCQVPRTPLKPASRNWNSLYDYPAFAKVPGCPTWRRRSRQAPPSEGPCPMIDRRLSHYGMSRR